MLPAARAARGLVSRGWKVLNGLPVAIGWVTDSASASLGGELVVQANRKIVRKIDRWIDGYR